MDTTSDDADNERQLECSRLESELGVQAMGSVSVAWGEADNGEGRADKSRADVRMVKAIRGEADDDVVDEGEANGGADPEPGRLIESAATITSQPGPLGHASCCTTQSSTLRPTPSLRRSMEPSSASRQTPNALSSCVTASTMLDGWRGSATNACTPRLPVRPTTTATAVEKGATLVDEIVLVRDQPQIVAARKQLPSAIPLAQAAPCTAPPQPPASRTVSTGDGNRCSQPVGAGRSLTTATLQKSGWAAASAQGTGSETTPRPIICSDCGRLHGSRDAVQHGHVTRGSPGLHRLHPQLGNGHEVALARVLRQQCCASWRCVRVHEP